MKSLFWAFLSCLLPWGAIGQENETTITFQKNNSILSIGKQVYFLEDKEGKLTFEDIQKTAYQKQFQLSTQEIPNFGTTRSKIWIKLVVSNQTRESIYLEVAQAMAWYIDFYKPNEADKPTLAVETGMMRPIQNREVDSNFFVFELPQNINSQTYYFSIQSDFPLTVPLFLAKKSALMEKSNFYHLFFGMFWGLIMIMFFYNLFLAYSVRDTLYLYYCFYLLTTLVMINFISGNFGYRFNPMTYFSQYFLFFGMLATNIIAIFLILLLSLSKQSSLYKVLVGLIVLYWIFSGINVVTGRYVAFIDVVQLCTLLTYIYILFHSLRRYLRGNHTSRFVVFGFSFYLLSAIVYMFQNFALIPSNFFTSNAVVFGSSLEALLFSLALGDRFNKMRMEKEAAQAEALQKTQENERLLGEQNQMLEAQVQTRTEELQALNEELNSTVEELSLTLELLETQKQLVETINNKITASINYAQTIQGAILPAPEYLQKHLREYFLLYRPKDVVSGDFYWVQQLPNCLVVAVVDCTGHGVAGSFMSLIGINFLNGLEQEMAHITPAQIIEKMNEAVEKSLKQNERQSFNEGMDLAICKIYPASNDNFLVEFAGAKRPLYHIAKDTKELHIIEGNRKSVGNGIYPPYAFTSHQLTIKKGDMLYMCSDGFVDQNNPQRKKFGEKMLQNLLVDIADKPAPEQGTILANALDEHQEKAEQRDDITLLGVRLS